MEVTNVIVTVSEVLVRVKVCVNKAGAGSTHMTFTLSPQSVAGKAVRADTSKIEHEGMAIVVVRLAPKEHGASKLSNKLETAVANCPLLGILDRVNPLALHRAAASFKGTGSKKITGS